MTKREHMQIIEEVIKRRESIVAAGVGCGITAKAAEKGGADIIITYNTAVYRIQGIPTAMAFLPYDDCNELSFSVAAQVLSVVKQKPVMIGIGAHDPRRNLKALVRKAKELGFSGISNEPFIGAYEGDLRSQLEAAGLGFTREVQLIEEASEAGMMTLAYVFKPQEATEMVKAGADFIGAMVGGVTSGGDAKGAKTLSLNEAVKKINAIIKAVKKTEKNIPVLIHGGPLNDIKPVAQALHLTGANGYITGSTGERIPTEIAVSQRIKEYKSINMEVSS